MLSDSFVFVQRQLDDLRAVGIRTLTDERDALPHLIFDGALGDAFVRAPERRVVSCDPLLSQLVHTLSDCPPRLRETAARGRRVSRRRGSERRLPALSSLYSSRASRVTPPRR